MSEVDRALIDLAARQHQVFSRRQAADAGVSPSTLWKRLASGRLIECSVTGLHLPGVTLTYRGQLQAGLLDLGPDALVSGRAAAHLLGLDGFDEGPLEYLGPRSIRNKRTAGIVRTSSLIGPLDRTVVDGLPCTSATRTVVELLRGGPGDAEAAADALASATRQRLTAPAVVSRRLAALGRRGRRAATTFDEIAKLGAVESGLERRFVRVVQDAGLPAPQLQQRHELPGVGAVRVDFECPTYGVVVEVGGRRGYLSREERQGQERRRTALQLAGKTVYFFTRDDVFADPGHVVRTLFAALAAERAAG